jgi:hypothetical protein
MIMIMVCQVSSSSGPGLRVSDRQAPAVNSVALPPALAAWLFRVQGSRACQRDSDLESPLIRLAVGAVRGDSALLG